MAVAGAAIGALLVSGVGVIYTGRSVKVAADSVAAARDEIRLSEQGQVNERYSRGVEHLGSDSLDVRVGGILALEQIANDAPSRAAAVRAILNSFISIHAPRRDVRSVRVIPRVSAGSFNPRHVAQDTGVALATLGRVGGPISLSYLDLGGAAFSSGDYANSWFWATDLSSSAAFSANMQGSVFCYSDLSFVFFSRIDLRGGNFESANLTGARLEQSDLRNANFTNATLAGALLIGSDLRGAKITADQLATTVTDASTKLPEAPAD
ncbi:pentapeptide repeat-containing protein [Micromonospora sp. WMMD967]|uniref:pentapeptide repeat-containing protein n=1 Tax=Micromonospora sp. WMMD967 TaxID=3016101 RepID=UPI00241681E1|nr:pentapeptide repeat-containing protein [Micromonospora sp. WMMD967]MDG4838368.1 pentapeptide repeat-containing protein [Micromonospora sp. WMMD967]